MDDLISREKAIDAMEQAKEQYFDRKVIIGKMQDIVNNLPSAQPEKRTDKCTETHACDLISRQAAIDAILAVTGNSSVRELYEHVQEHGLSEMWSGGVNAAIDIIIAVPPAQPESCVDTIDALNESIKHFDDMAEECRRNANIERNDYMDMRDDAAEYRQLSIWLNELKWLRERFQSQPDLSGYSDKLWKRAYERGRAEAQAEIVRCKECRHRDPEDHKCDCGHDIIWQLPRDDKWYCADAERRTDE